MKDMPSYVYGIVDWPMPIDKMASILRSAGLDIYQGRYSIRINQCEDFSFEEYGGDIGGPSIEAGATSIERMKSDALLVSKALATAGVEHEFEVYDEDDVIVVIIGNGIEQSGAADDPFGGEQDGDRS